MVPPACFASILTFSCIISSVNPLKTIHPRQVLPRWDNSVIADDEAFDGAVCKANRFLAAMKGTDEAAGKIFASTTNPPTVKSPWKGDLKLEMRQWGWDLSDDTDEEFLCDFDGLQEYKNMFDNLKLNLKPKSLGGDNVCYKITHGYQTEDKHDIPLKEQKYTVYKGNVKKEYIKTGGKVQCAINRAGGVIIAQARLSPGHAAERFWGEKPKTEDLPALRTMADMLWGFWYRDNDKVKDIRYFWSQGVTNEDTAAIVATVLKNAGQELKPWPGIEFQMDTMEGKALLGSPNGIAFAYMLIGHKEELGNKIVTKAVLFLSGEEDKKTIDDRKAELLFYVEDALDLMMQPCQAQCCSANSGPDAPKSLPSANLSSGKTERELSKRALPHPSQPHFDNSAFNFIRDMCSTYAYGVPVQTFWPELTSSSFFEASLGNGAGNWCMGGLSGCTAVLVISRKHSWWAHFAEVPSVVNPQRWQDDIFTPLEYGGGSSTVPEGSGLRYRMNDPSGPFALGTNPKAYIITPLKRRAHWTHPQPQTLAFPEVVQQLETRLRDILGHGNRVQTRPYIANAAVEWTLQYSWDHSDVTDLSKPYKTPFGKVLLTYDPNAQVSGLTRKAGWDLWLADGTEPIGHDEWPAYPAQ